MKTVKWLSVIVSIIIISTTSCGNAPMNAEKSTSNITSGEPIYVYYFHTNYRCKTCRTVQKVSEEAVKELNDKQVTFKSFNLEEPLGKELAAKHEIQGQTLIIIQGSHKEDITADGFLYAVSKPEKLKEIITQKVKKLK